MSDKKTVAIIGASADRNKYSNKSVRAHLKQGWEVYPVNTKGGEIEGLKAYTSLAEIPVPLDRVTIYLPPQIGVKALADIAAVKPGEFIVNPGAESDELIEEGRRLGLGPIVACRIVEIGVSPSQFPDA